MRRAASAVRELALLGALLPALAAAAPQLYETGPSQDLALVRFVNARLAQMRSNGEWTTIYDRWLAGPLGPAPAPPKAVYGRATP